MAEADRDVYRREQAALAREKEIMKDVPGWEVSNDFLHCAPEWSRLAVRAGSVKPRAGRRANCGSLLVAVAGWQEGLPHRAVHPQFYLRHLKGESARCRGGADSGLGLYVGRWLRWGGGDWSQARPGLAWMVGRARIGRALVGATMVGQTLHLRLVEHGPADSCLVARWLLRSWARLAINRSAILRCPRTPDPLAIVPSFNLAGRSQLCPVRQGGGSRASRSRAWRWLALRRPPRRPGWPCRMKIDKPDKRARLPDFLQNTKLSQKMTPEARVALAGRS